MLMLLKSRIQSNKRIFPMKIRSILLLSFVFAVAVSAAEPERDMKITGNRNNTIGCTEKSLALCWLMNMALFPTKVDKSKQKSFFAFLERVRGARGERENFFSREKKFSRFHRIISPYREQSYEYKTLRWQ